jgi:hypothetical protein
MDRFLVWQKNNFQKGGDMTSIEQVIQSISSLQTDLLNQQIKIKNSTAPNHLLTIAMTLLHPHSMYKNQLWTKGGNVPILQTLPVSIKETSDILYGTVLCPSSSGLLSNVLDHVSHAISHAGTKTKMFVMADPKRLKMNLLSDSEDIRLFYGTDGSGSIKEPTNVDSYIRWVRNQTKWAPISISVCCSPKDTLVQLYMSLMLLGNGGTLVLTVDNLFSPLFSYVVSILCQSFEEVWLHKPETSHTLMSDFYLVANRLESHRDLTFDLAKLIATGEQIDSTTDKMPSVVAKQLATAISIFVKKQTTCCSDLFEILQILEKNGVADTDVIKKWHHQLITQDPHFRAFAACP